MEKQKEKEQKKKEIFPFFPLNKGYYKNKIKEFKSKKRRQKDKWKSYKRREQNKTRKPKKW